MKLIIHSQTWKVQQPQDHSIINNDDFNILQIIFKVLIPDHIMKFGIKVLHGGLLIFRLC